MKLKLSKRKEPKSSLAIGKKSFVLGIVLPVGKETPHFSSFPLLQLWKRTYTTLLSPDFSRSGGSQKENKHQELDLAIVFEWLLLVYLNVSRRLVLLQNPSHSLTFHLCSIFPPVTPSSFPINVRTSSQKRQNKHITSQHNTNNKTWHETTTTRYGIPRESTTSKTCITGQAAEMVRLSIKHIAPITISHHRLSPPPFPPVYSLRNTRFLEAYVCLWLLISPHLTTLLLYDTLSMVVMISTYFLSSLSPQSESNMASISVFWEKAKTNHV